MLAALLPALLPIVDKIFGNLFPDPAARAKATQDLLSQLMASDLGQLAVNAEEAKSGSLFRGGWRPFIGWVCGAALAFQYLFVPIATWVAALTGYNFPAPPGLDAVLWELMFGILGFGALRSFDKLKGIG
jgi:hypothetical protein